MKQEPDNAALIAAAASVVLTARRVIEATDRSSLNETNEALDAIHENIALAGGALLIIARRMNCEADVERMLKEGQDRVIAFLACAGLEGRA